MNVSRPAALALVLGAALVPALALPAGKGPAPADPLPSWNDGPVKKGLLDFVTRATKKGGPDYVPPEERVATFDNDGTLWPEKPLPEAVFVAKRLKVLVRKHPSLLLREPIKAVLRGGVTHLRELGEQVVVDLLVTSHSGMTQEEFEADARAFFKGSRHPTLRRPYTELAYRPMVELLELLRANGFQTWMCTGGSVDFVRAISVPMYGIPPQQVIGTSLRKEPRLVGGRTVLWRLPTLLSYNNKGNKPVNIDLHVGRRPLFAAGNVRSAGDVEMLSYCQGRKGPSFQLVINHDDGEREFSYRERDDATLSAARKHGWTVVSMKRDWKVIFRPRGE